MGHYGRIGQPRQRARLCTSVVVHVNVVRAGGQALDHDAGVDVAVDLSCQISLGNDQLLLP